MKKKVPTFEVALPLPPSVNHCYVRRVQRYVKNGRKRKRVMNILSSRAESWMEDARDKNLEAMNRLAWVPRDGKVVVELTMYWPDRRRRDAHNLLKLLCDSLEGFVCIDDKWMLTRIMDFHVDRDNPRVEVVAYDA